MARRKQRRGPTPPKKRAQGPTWTGTSDTGPTGAEVAIRAAAERAHRPLTGPAARGLIETAIEEGVFVDALAEVRNEGTFLAVITTEAAEVILHTLGGIPVRPEQRALAIRAWDKAIADEATHIGESLDKLTVIREWRRRQVAKLDVLVMDADLANAFLPPSGQRVDVTDGRLRRAAMMAPSLQAGAEATHRFYGPEEAKGIFRDALADYPEGAFEEQYLDALKAAMVRRHPEIAAVFADQVAEREALAKLDTDVLDLATDQPFRGIDEQGVRDAVAKALDPLDPAARQRVLGRLRLLYEASSGFAAAGDRE